MAQQAPLLRWDGRTTQETPVCWRRVARVSARLTQEQVRRFKHFMIFDMTSYLTVLVTQSWGGGQMWATW